MKVPFKLKLCIRFLQRIFSYIFNSPFDIKIYEGKILGDEIDKYLNILTKKNNLNSKYVHKVRQDMIHCYVLYGFTPKDYYLFAFYDRNSTKKLRKSFVSDVYKDYKLFSKEGARKYLELYDKYLFYNKAKKYFKRSVFCVNEHTQESLFCNYALNVGHLFIKPNSSSYGQGAMVADVYTMVDAIQLFDKIKNYSWIVEERLIQNERMAKWNSSSVNTVRINTFLSNRGFFILAPFMRTGRLGSIVDNGGAGGIYATIDDRTGELITDGFDEDGNIYVVHPDSKVKFKGEFIPKWKELIAIAENVHRECMADHVYVSWDFAYTDNGWVLIEGNWGQFICQQSSLKQGLKKQFDKYMEGKPLVK